MRGLGWFLLCAILCGCSTAPCADVLDYFAPGKLNKGTVAPFGGVCSPRQGVGPGAAIQPPAGPSVPPAPPAPINLPPTSVLPPSSGVPPVRGGATPPPVWPSSSGSGPGDTVLNANPYRTIRGPALPAVDTRGTR